jgi:hypothetical protein
MRITFLTILTFVFFGGAFVFEHYHKDNKALEQYAVLIQKNLQQNENEVQLLGQQLLADNKQDAPAAMSFLQQQKLGEKKYSILLYQKDSLLFWNNNKVYVTPDSADAVRCLDNGYYYVKK